MRRAGNLNIKMTDIICMQLFRTQMFFKFISTNFQFRQYYQQFNANLFQK